MSADKQRRAVAKLIAPLAFSDETYGAGYVSKGLDQSRAKRRRDALALADEIFDLLGINGQSS